MNRIRNFLRWIPAALAFVFAAGICMFGCYLLIPALGKLQEGHTKTIPSVRQLELDAARTKIQAGIALILATMGHFYLGVKLRPPRSKPKEPLRAVSRPKSYRQIEQAITRAIWDAEGGPTDAVHDDVLRIMQDRHGFDLEATFDAIIELEKTRNVLVHRRFEGAVLCSGTTYCLVEW